MGPSACGLTFFGERRLNERSGVVQGADDHSGARSRRPRGCGDRHA
jgi:hypothetical protein